MTTTEPTVEECLRELREMCGPEPQIIISIRDCGEETITVHDTTVEYSAQIGMNGRDFDADSLSDLVAQVRKWHSEQSEKGKREQ